MKGADIDRGDAAEEAVRAEWYGLLAQLFYQAPDAPMHERLRAARRVAAEPATELDGAWHALLDVAELYSPTQLATEYDALFGGVGKPDVFLFGSHYLSGFLNEKPLVLLRDDLRAFGLSRADAVLETEDHIACLLDAMRQLIGLGDSGPDSTTTTTLEQQRSLFSRHVASWTDSLAEALLRHPKAQFYARLADLLLVFMAIERQAFEMMEAQGKTPAEKKFAEAPIDRRRQRVSL